MRKKLLILFLLFTCLPLFVGVKVLKVRKTTDTYTELMKSCVAHWKMNEDTNSTVVLNSIDSNSNGTAQQDTCDINTVGVVGGALTFNDTSDYIIVDTYINHFLTPTYRNSFSVGGWFEPTDGQASNYQGLFGDNGSEKKLYLWIRPDGKIVFTYQVSSDGGGGGAISANPVFTNGQQTWHHIIVVVTKTSDTSMQTDIYFDGVLVGTGINTNGDVVMSEFGNISTAIGNVLNDEDFDPTTVYAGVIDNVTLHNKALSQAEIDCLYNSGNGREE